MKKKFIAVYALIGVLALGSTALTSCVDDNESASVTAIRDAKAQQLAALAELSTAEAEVQKAEALYKQALTAQTEQATEQEKQKFEAEIESLRAMYEQQAQNYKQQMITNAAYWRNTLYSNFYGANNKLKELEGDLIEAQLNLASAKAGVTSAEAAAKVTILQQEEKKAQAQARKDALTALGGNDRSELLAQKEELDVKISQQENVVKQKEAAAGEAKKAFNESSVAYEGNTTYVDGTPVTVEPTLATGKAIKFLLNNYGSVLNQPEDLAPEDHAATYTINKYTLKQSAVTSQKNALSDILASRQEALGKEGDEADANGSAYAQYAQDKKDMDAAKKAYDDAAAADKPGLLQPWRDAVTTYEQATEEGGYLYNALKGVEEAEATLKEFNDAVAAFSGDDYTAYEAAINATLEAGAAWDAAEEAVETELLALADLRGESQAVTTLLTSNPNIDEEIAKCDQDIADADGIIAAAGNVENVSVTWHPAYDYVDENGDTIHVSGWYEYIYTNVDAYYKECEIEVENLKAEIEMQQQIVAQCKAELEAAINSGATDDVPATDTPAEEAPTE